MLDPRQLSTVPYLSNHVIRALTTSVLDPFGSVTRDPDMCSLWIGHTGDLKTTPWDDLEIPTSLCGEDQKAIRF